MEFYDPNEFNLISGLFDTPYFFDYADLPQGSFSDYYGGAPFSDYLGTEYLYDTQTGEYITADEAVLRDPTAWQEFQQTRITGQLPSTLPGGPNAANPNALFTIGGVPITAGHLGLGTTALGALAGLAGIIQRAAAGDQTATQTVNRIVASASPQERAALDAALTNLQGLQNFATGSPTSVQAQLGARAPLEEGAFLQSVTGLSGQQNQLGGLLFGTPGSGPRTLTGLTAGTAGENGMVPLSMPGTPDQPGQTPGQPQQQVFYDPATGQLRVTTTPLTPPTQTPGTPGTTPGSTTPTGNGLGGFTPVGNNVLQSYNPQTQQYTNITPQQAAQLVASGQRVFDRTAGRWVLDPAGRWNQAYGTRPTTQSLGTSGQTAGGQTAAGNQIDPGGLTPSSSGQPLGTTNRALPGLWDFDPATGTITERGVPTVAPTQGLIPQMLNETGQLSQQQTGILNAFYPTMQGIAQGQLPTTLSTLVEQAYQPALGDIATQAIQSARERGFAGGAELLGSGPGGALAGPALASLQGQIAQSKLGLLTALPNAVATASGAYSTPIALRGQAGTNLSNLNQSLLAALGGLGQQGMGNRLDYIRSLTGVAGTAGNIAGQQGQIRSNNASEIATRTQPTSLMDIVSPLGSLLSGVGQGIAGYAALNRPQYNISLSGLPIYG